MVNTSGFEKNPSFLLKALKAHLQKYALRTTTHQFKMTDLLWSLFISHNYEISRYKRNLAETTGKMNSYMNADLETKNSSSTFK